jgi:hypothetical protein
MGFAGPGGALTLGVTAAAAVATLAAAAGLARRSRAARRLTLVCETGILAVAVLEAILSTVLAGVPLVPVAALTRVAVPLAVILLLRRPDSRAAFDRPAMPSATTRGGLVSTEAAS